VDYITKPFSAPVVRARVKTQLSLVRADVLLATRQQVVQCLGAAAEFKDNETGLHVVRMSHYTRLVAQALGMPQQLFSAAPRHDVGKIGIPDAILRKPGRLDEAELVVMRQHPEIGARIIGPHKDGMLAMAHRIALCHHEKWDGSGYPHGLAGEAIPLAPASSSTRPALPPSPAAATRSPRSCARCRTPTTARPTPPRQARSA